MDAEAEILQKAKEDVVAILQKANNDIFKLRVIPVLEKMRELVDKRESERELALQNAAATARVTSPSA